MAFRFLCSLLCAAALHAQEPKDLRLFLLIGQSNMAGRGIPEPQDREPIPRVWALSRDLQWTPAVDPLHYDKPEIAGVGIGRSFARLLAKADPSASIGLIPAAMGGSALSEWEPGGKLYTEALRRARAAMKSGTMRGILWHQGETDAAKEPLARTYRERWTTFITALRKDLGAPGLPVVVGEIGEFLKPSASPYAVAVNEQLALLPLTVPHTAFVSSAGLKPKEDQVHFDTPSLREFGRRYALAYLSLDPSW